MLYDEDDASSAVIVEKLGEDLYLDPEDVDRQIEARRTNRLGGSINKPTSFMQKINPIRLFATSDKK